jgi:hypothetical protein
MAKHNIMCCQFIFEEMVSSFTFVPYQISEGVWSFLTCFLPQLFSPLSYVFRLIFKKWEKAGQVLQLWRTVSTDVSNTARFFW